MFHFKWVMKGIHKLFFLTRQLHIMLPFWLVIFNTDCVMRPRDSFPFSTWSTLLSHFHSCTLGFSYHSDAVYCILYWLSYFLIFINYRYVRWHRRASSIVYCCCCCYFFCLPSGSFNANSFSNPILQCSWFFPFILTMFLNLNLLTFSWKLTSCGTLLYLG